MNNYNYIATVQKPTIVTHSTVGSFTDTENVNLIIAKHNHIEIYDFSLEARLRLLKDFPVNGGITTLKLLRPTGQIKDFLLLGTESNDKSSFKFFVLSWDADKNDVMTRDSHEILDHIGEGHKIFIFNHDCSLIGLRTLHKLSVNSVKFFHLSREGKIEVEYSIRLDTLQDALYWDSRKEILDIKFLHNYERRILAVLYKVDETGRKVATYEVTSVEDGDEDEDEDDQYRLVEGPWSTRTNNAAKLLIPVPPPYGGVLAVGDKKIAYCSKSMPVEEQFHHGFVFEKRRDKPTGCVGLDYDFGDIVHGAVNTDDMRFLFSGQNRNLQMLILTPDDKKVTQLKMYLLGETSIASSLSYLGNGIVYVGSRSGDSELIKLNLQPDPGGDYTKLEVLERFPSLGPVSDSCLAVLDQQRQLVTCSGAYNDGSLRILTKEFQMEEQSSCDAAGIDGMWWLKFSKDNPYDGFLVANVLEETLIFQNSPEGLNLNPDENMGFFYSDRTLLCHNALDSIVTQVTSTSVRLVCLRTRQLQFEWKVPHSQKIVCSSAKDTEVLVSTEGAHLYYLEIIGNILKLKETKKLDHDSTSVAIGPTGDAPNDTKYAAVGAWFENSITLYSLPDLAATTFKRLDAQPRSLLICPLEGISYLLCGTAEGDVVYFTLDATTGALTCMKSISFGMRPVTLHLIAHKNTRHVFVASDHPAIIYSSCKDLHISTVNRKGINQICSFSTSTVPSGLAIATADRLTFEALDDTKIDVHSFYLHEQPLCIAHQHQSQTFTVACVKYSESSETSNIHLLDERTFDILDTYRLEPSRFGVVYGVSLLSCVYSGDNQEYVCVGTAGMISFDRRIKVLVIRQGRLELVSQTSMLYGGPLFCLTAFSGMLLAGSGCEFVIFKWDIGERTLQQVYKHQAAGQEYASCLQCLGDSIFGGKLAQLMHFTEGRGIESLAHNASHRLTAVDILKAGVYVGATAKQALLFFRRNEGATDEESGLEVVGQYDLGDCVTRFCHGSLVSVGDITTTLFSTINGGIGLLASLPEKSYGFMEQLQGLLRHFINQADEGWRLYYHKIPADASKLLDGDLIMSFSDMEINKKRDIAREMGMSVEDIDNKVKEVTHFL